MKLNLSCAAAFARQGLRAFVLEQHTVPGGYATTIKRPGGFEFDVSPSNWPISSERQETETGPENAAGNSSTIGRTSIPESEKWRKRRRDWQPLPLNNTAKR